MIYKNEYNTINPVVCIGSRISDTDNYIFVNHNARDKMCIRDRSDFLLDVPDNGIGCSDPAVELAFLGAYAFLLHCPDGCALMDLSLIHIWFRAPVPAVRRV